MSTPTRAGLPGRWPPDSLVNSSGAWIYVLYGDDTFGRDEAVRTLKERMRQLPAGEHNLTELAGPDATVAALRMQAETVPFLAERRMVVVHGLIARLQGRGGGERRRGRSPKTAAPTDAEYTDLLAFLPDIPATSSIAFVEPGEVDSKPIKDAIPSGRALVNGYAKPQPNEVPSWIRKRARLLEVGMDESAVRELATLGGDDLRRLDAEIRKLGAYADGRTITREDVRQLVVGGEILKWALLDALADRRREQSLVTLRRLYEQGEPPEALLSRDVAPLYRRLLVAKELLRLDRRERANADLTALNVNPRTLPRLSAQAAHFEPDELERAVDLLLDLDRRIKTGETEPEAALELAVVRLCSRLGAEAA